MLRNVAIFCTLILGVAAYPYLAGKPIGFEAAPAVARPTAQPEQTIARVESASTPRAGRKVQLDGDQRGHYVAEFSLNGRKISALVDTGASVVAINRSTAKRLGINLSAGDFTATATTANGAIKAAPVVLDRVEIGRILVRDVDAIVLDDAALNTVLIGMSFLKSVQFQVANNKLTLQQQ